MGGRALETLVGAAVIVVAVAFVAFVYERVDVADGAGTVFHAEFEDIGGLQAGDDVRIAGIRVGRVTGLDLDPDWYLAKVAMTIDPGVSLPRDTIVTIASASLLGGHYVSLHPGTGEVAGDGYLFTDTQGAINLIDAVSRSMFGGLEE